MASEEAVRVVRGYFADLSAIWLSERIRLVDTACGRVLVGRLEAAGWPRWCMSARSQPQASGVELVDQGPQLSVECVLVDETSRQLAVAAVCVVATGEIVSITLSHAAIRGRREEFGKATSLASPGKTDQGGRHA